MLDCSCQLSVTLKCSVLQVRLLKDVLDAWKKEVERKPPAMSVDDAYEVLGLKRGVQNNEATVRKAYYRLAQQFHPDKNPEGRVRLCFYSTQLEVSCPCHEGIQNVVIGHSIQIRHFDFSVLFV